MGLFLRNFTYFKLCSKKMFTGKKPVKWLATGARPCKVVVIWERLAISFQTETFNFNCLPLSSETSTVQWNNTARHYFRNYKATRAFHQIVYTLPSGHTVGLCVLALLWQGGANWLPCNELWMKLNICRCQAKALHRAIFLPGMATSDIQEGEGREEEEKKGG